MPDTNDAGLVEVTVQEANKIADGKGEGMGFLPVGAKIKVDPKTAAHLKAKRFI
jgi:hypothetical protein